MKTVLTLFIIAIFFSCSNKENNTSLEGKWAYNHSHDDKTYHDFIAYFKTDGTYDGIEDGKVTIAGGRYTQNNDTMYMNDASCNPHPKGSYKIIMWAKDSMRLDPIIDSCDNRREGTKRFLFKRMNK